MFRSIGKRDRIDVAIRVHRQLCALSIGCDDCRRRTRSRPLDRGDALVAIGDADQTTLAVIAEQIDLHAGQRVDRPQVTAACIMLVDFA